ncbi:MAG: helix-turn-helix domain-containing protein [Bacteroidales bacterium]|nr:helix-turn-helix domain-containing protein [Bacteroidales bacterium]
MMRLHIKNMVCPRCIAAVRALLIEHGLQVEEVNLGDATVQEPVSADQLSALATALKGMGFELLDDPRSQLVERLRLAVLEWVRMSGDRPRLSDYLSRLLAKDYSALSKLFSEVRGVTIERYAILHRVEYAKELLCYSQESTSEIAYTLGYSSPAHLSSQFKQVTGMTPKAFRQQAQHTRIPLDEI